jgi:hypothetical protein
MPVDGHPAGIAHNRQDQNVPQGKLLRIAELSQADHHIRVSLFGLVSIPHPKIDIDNKARFRYLDGHWSV